MVTHAFESLKVLRNDTVMSHPSRNHIGIVTWWPKRAKMTPNSILRPISTYDVIDYAVA